MDKELINKISDEIENDSNEAEATKRLCVHDLTRKLKEKQKKEKVKRTVIFSTVCVSLGVLTLLSS